MACGEARDGTATSRQVSRRGTLAHARRAGWILALLALGSCSQLVEYTDELVDRRTGRTLVVRTPATFGGVVGFLLGIPLDIIALPVTYPVYAVQENDESVTADPMSTMLFPSFVLWRAGTLVAVPFDAVEFVAYRAWLPPETPTAEEQERLEVDEDGKTLPVYGVERIFPRLGPPR